MKRNPTTTNHTGVAQTDLIELARAHHEKQIAWRRHLHENPELSNEEYETTEFIRKEIGSLGLRELPVSMPTGLVAELDGTAPGPTIAIRTDIDALPVTEQTGLPFASKRVGRMHACGHDVHMATVLGAALLLSHMRSRICGTVRFIFQPAEEHPPGGAMPMIANGALNDVSVIFGLHVDPDVPVGKIGLRDGPTMAAVYDFDLTVHGRGGHAAKPHLTVDAIVTAAEIIESLQKIPSREIDPIEPVVITFGQIKGGIARNVIAERVQIVGTARTLSAAAAKQVPQLIKRTAENVARARGAACTITELARYPVLENDASVNRLFADCFTALVGAGKTVETKPTLGGEDFACYLREVPGAMFRLGVMNKKIGADKPWHSSQFIVDEDALMYGAALLASAAIRFGEDKA